MSERADEAPLPRRPPIEQVIKENERLRGDLERAERERDRLRREVGRLRGQLDAARRAGFRQAAPFSKGAPTAAPKRPGRKAGAAHGRHAHRPVPRHVDEHYEAPVRRTCPHCQGAVTAVEWVSQYQEDLPPVRPLVREFRIEVGRCTQCGRRVQGRHPLQTSDAVGAAAVQLGPQAISLATVLHTQLGVPVAKVATLCAQTFQLSVTAGEIIRALHRVAARAEPTYQALVTAVQQSPHVVPDEAGWRENGQPRWLWVYTTPTTTVYRITPGRSFADATLVLPATYTGVLTRDGWVVYRDYAQAGHQSCVRHLVRRCEDLITDHPHSAFAPQVQTILQTALAVRDRRTAGTISEHGVAVARGRLTHQLDRLLDTPVRLPAVQRFARHLDREFPYLFSFLYDPTVDATNWRAEQAIRPAVVLRKVCGGNRSARGAQTQYVLATLVRTAAQRHIALPATIATLLRSARPIVPNGFGAPP